MGDDQSSTIPAPPESVKPDSKPTVVVRNGRVVVLSASTAVALAAQEERERIDANFSEVVESMTALVLAPETRTARDIVFVEGKAVVQTSRGTLETYVRGLLAGDSKNEVLKKILVCLVDAERAPQRRENKLPLLIVLGTEVRLAWLTVGVIKREGGKT